MLSALDTSVLVWKVNKRYTYTQHWSPSFCRTKTIPHSVKAFLEKSHESRGVGVCVCPSGAKPGVFSIKAIHPHWQVSVLAPFQLYFFIYLFFTNPVNSVCGLQSFFFQIHSLSNTHTHTLYEHRYQAVKLFNSPSQTILHIRQSKR